MGSACSVFDRKRAGVLLPLASLPGGHGIGDLGSDALRFIDWLASAGMGWWQMLPVGPLGACNSPYSSPSSFAGEALYLSLEELARDGLLDAGNLPQDPGLSEERVDIEAAARIKLPLLEQARRAFFERGEQHLAPWASFLSESSGWMDEWLRFRGGDPDLERFLQFQFARQWGRLRSRAAERGVLLLGDLPFFCEAFSADVTARPELFLLNEDGHPSYLTGVPPDAFSETGQLWGHPHYDWAAHSAESFRWWIDRVRAQLARFDAVRLDHFLGLARAWRVRAGSENARDGCWIDAPGRDLLEALSQELGPLPLIAEDLGEVTPEAHSLRDDFCLPGMRVLQWGFGEDAGDDPSDYPPLSVAYPGTHDNATVIEWWGSLHEGERERFLARSQSDGRDVAWDMVRLCLSSGSCAAIVQLQDLLALGAEARTNTPGTSEGNWSWRVRAEQLSPALAERARALVEDSGRLA